jgi:hypothetical protein
MKIYKYTLEITDTQSVEIPSRHILSAVEQNNEIVVYASIDDDEQKPAKYTFKIVGTGNPSNIDLDQYTFLNTVSLFGGSLIFHVFYI